MQTLPRPTTRLDSVDALRGFAVMAILWVHSLEHFIFPIYPDPSTLPAWLNILDQATFTGIFSLFAGKAYAIFSLLFGFTFYVQYTNQQIKGKDFGYRFLWRMILLAGFATINAAFFPGGDVLLLFSIVSIVLFAFRRSSNLTLLVFALLFLLQPVEWLHYFASLIDPDYRLPDLGVGAMYEEIAAYTKDGEWRQFLWGNITLGQKASLLWAVGAGRYFQTAGLFLLGLYIGRKSFFADTPSNQRFWSRTLIVSAILFGIFYPWKVTLYDQMNDPMIKQTVGVVIDMWQKLAFTAVLVSSFIGLYHSKRFRRLTEPLRYYGKMSMTNYITQSIIGALLFFPIGLSLAPYCGYTLSFLIGIILFVVQVQLCKLWLKSHRQGPFEWIWHKLTWFN